MKDSDLQALQALPPSSSCRLIDFDKAEAVPGIIPKTFFLIVSGTKPWITMQVELHPLIYIRQPDYWGIEVVGCQSGIGLPATAPGATACTDVAAAAAKAPLAPRPRPASTNDASSTSPSSTPVRYGSAYGAG